MHLVLDRRQQHIEGARRVGNEAGSFFPQSPTKPKIKVDEPFGKNLPRFGVCYDR